MFSSADGNPAIEHDFDLELFAAAIVERPRASMARTVAAVPVAAPAPVHPSGDKLRIRLPRRPRAVSAPAPPPTARQRTASTSDGKRHPESPSSPDLL